MRDRFLSMIGMPNDGATRNLSVKKLIIIFLRSSHSKYMQNKSDGTTRRWPVNFLDSFVENIGKLFPSHEVKYFSDMNSTLMGCPPCQIELIREADIAIGYHGAGLTNTMYMRPGNATCSLLEDNKQI